MFIIILITTLSARARARTRAHVSRAMAFLPQFIEFNLAIFWLDVWGGEHYLERGPWPTLTGLEGWEDYFLRNLTPEADWIHFERELVDRLPPWWLRWPESDSLWPPSPLELGPDEPR